MTNEELTMSNEEAKEIIIQERDSLKANPAVKVEDCLYEAFDVAIKVLEQYCKDAGELSDGYHTFNQLYHQRAVLFASIVRQNKNKAWKSFKHSDGSYCFDSNGEWFIVGVDTPKGSYTYHYAKEYWDMFDCQELECGKEWDGHTEEDVTRLLSLEQQPRTGHWSRKIKVDAYDIAGAKTWGIKCQCDRCDFTTIVVEDFGYYTYCPNCGTKMEVEK